MQQERPYINADNSVQTRRRVPRPVYLLGVTAIGLLAACGGSDVESKGVNGDKPAFEPSATREVIPTPTATLIPTPEPTATPEPKFKFTEYGVYYGTRVDGGRISLIFLPDGKVIYTYFSQTVSCTNGTSIPGGRGVLVSRSNHGPDNLLDDFGHDRFLGRLVDGNTIEGTQRFTQFDGRGMPTGNCETGDIPFRATLIGTGRQAAVRGFSMAYSGPPDIRTLADLEQSCRCALP